MLLKNHVFFLSFFVLSTSLYGQTLFTVLDTVPDYSRYSSEGCYSAINRIKKRIYNHNNVWLDTVLYNPKEAYLPSNDSLIREANKCLSMLAMDSIPNKDADMWAEMYLAANRDDDADAVFFRQYPHLEDSSLYDLFRVHTRVYKTARPIRVDRVKKLYSYAMEQLPADSVFYRAALLNDIINLAYDAGDSAAVESLTKDLVGLAGSMSRSLEESVYGHLVKIAAYGAFRKWKQHERMDSLAIGTSSYINLEKAHWENFFPDLTKPATNIKVAPLHADYWFSGVANSNNDSVSYEYKDSGAWPIPGQPAMLFFLSGGCHDDKIHSGSKGLDRANPPFGQQCWTPIAMIKLLKREFPELNITVVVATHGNVGQAKPMSPQEEADLLADYFLGFHRLPINLAVMKTDFIRVPAPDRRRIDVSSEVDENDTLAINNPVAHIGNALLVDRDGIAVHFFNGVLNREPYHEIRTYLQAIFREHPFISDSKDP